jgi:sugar diacid utilization regulator
VESQELRLLKLLATTAPDLAMEYEDDVLRGLLARDDAAETLDILEDRSHNPAQAVAERRSIPRRTVERAVQRAARLTGLDFNLPAQRLEFEVALRLHRLRQATSETKLEGP